MSSKFKYSRLRRKGIFCFRIDGERLKSRFFNCWQSLRWGFKKFRSVIGCLGHTIWLIRFGSLHRECTVNAPWCWWNILKPHLVQHLDPYEDLAFHEGPMCPRNHQLVANVRSLDILIEFCSNKVVSMLCLARKPMTRPSREDSQTNWSISDFWGNAMKSFPVLVFYYFSEIDWSDLEAGNYSHSQLKSSFGYDQNDYETIT